MSQSLVRLRSVAETADDIARAWLEYGKEYAKYPSLWDSSLAFASGPLRPEGGTLRDYSGRTGGAAWSVGAGDVPKYTQSSVRGQAFWAGSYDGSNDLATAASLSVSGSLTWCAWLNFTAAQTDAYPGILTQTSNDLAQGFSLNVYTGVGADLNKVYAVASDGTNVALALSSAAAINTGWRHAACILDRAAQTLSLYLDGVLQGTPASTSVVGSMVNTKSLRIGAREATIPIENFKGLISSTCVHYRVLTGSEISILATHPLAAYETVRPKYWTFPTTAATHLWPWQIRRSRRVRGHR